MSNLIHRIWMGGEMPEKFRQYGHDWQQMNPDWVCHEWGEEEIMDNKWINEKVIQHMIEQSVRPGADEVAFYTHLADVIDYELLYKYGGWYFNTDLKPLRPLSVLGQDMHTPVLAMEDDIHPVNMAMYSPPNHPFFAKIIELLPQRYFSMPGAFMNATTGVQLLQHALGQYDGKVNFYPRQVFNPIHFSEFEYGTEPDIDRDFGPMTIAVHLWGHRTNQRGQRILED